MNYNEAKKFLSSLSNLQPESQKDILKNSKSLKRLSCFLKMLGNPENKIKSYIHVAGTSGKGSLVNYLHSIFATAGKTTASTISPHIKEITERWRINQKQISKKEFIALVEKMKKAIEGYSEKYCADAPSFFEILTVMSFFYFAENKAEVAIIETGCGGRYDATNVIPDKTAAIITSIGMDHMKLLGNTKEKIAKAKAGIITKNCFVFTAEKDKKIIKMLRNESTKNKAKAFMQINPMADKIISINSHGSDFIYKNEKYKIKAIGSHQIKNAIFALEIAEKLGVKKDVIKKGLLSAKQPLRMEIVSNNPIIILDGAHNLDKIKTTINSFVKDRIFEKTAKNIHIITGFAKDKDYLAMINEIAKLKPKTVACTRQCQNEFRKIINPWAIAQRMKKLAPHAKCKTFLDPQEAFMWSKKQAKKQDLILSTGSIFLSSELKKN